MPPRLEHKKSRMGCTRCKARKVKCDEERPVCSACRRHHLECIYLEPGPPAPRRESEHSGSGPSSSHHRSPGSSDSPHTAPSSSAGGGGGGGRAASVLEHDDGEHPATEDRRVLELQLMHRYMQSFSDIFIGIHNATIAEVWRDIVPSLAIHHPFLLHAIYAVTTRHFVVKKTQALEAEAQSHDACYDPIVEPPIRTLIPSAPPVADNLDLEEMRRAHIFYFSLAVREQRMAVANLHADNADAVCIATMLISSQGFLLENDLDMVETTYTPPVQWMLLCASIQSVVRACGGWLGPKAATSMIFASARTLHLFDYADTDGDPFFQPILDFAADTEPADLAVYRPVVDYIGAIRRAAVAAEPAYIAARRFLSFGTIIPHQFIGLVRQHRPRALVLLAYLFAMTKEVEGVWWFLGAGKRHVDGLQSLVPPAWQWAMRWPRDMVATRTAPARRELLERKQMC